MRDDHGKQICFPIFPGVELSVHDIHGSLTSPEHAKLTGLIEINFCTGGRFELFCDACTRIQLQEGDLSVNLTDPVLQYESALRFPTGLYQGVELLIDPSSAQAWCDKNLPVLSINIESICHEVLQGHWIRFGKASLQCEHIFRELAAIHDQTPPAWLKLKVLELMLSLEDGILESEQEYIPSDRIKLAVHLRDHLIGLRLHDFSLEAMAKEHRLSTAHMQRIFKAVYGQPMYSYLKQYRLEEAAAALRNSDCPVSEIAEAAGYQSVSKFTDAFKHHFGKTPAAIRRSKAFDHNGIE